MDDRPGPLLRLGLIVLALPVGLVSGLGISAETGWAPSLTAGATALVFALAMWWATR